MGKHLYSGVLLLLIHVLFRAVLAQYTLLAHVSSFAVSKDIV